MLRNIDLKEISDGRLYDANDMVKAGSDDCSGCWDCCQGMGDSIFLDPLDIYRLTTGLECTFDQLLETCVDLHVVEGIILPNMRMVGKEERCAFLNEKGRCNIHSIRPGICRLFPLGRCYEEGSFKYFLQIHECKKAKTKVKVKKWIDTSDFKKNEEYIITWHEFQKKLQEILKSFSNEAMVKKINRYVLEQFFRKPYDGTQDFYEQFEVRLKLAKRYVGIAG